MAEEKTAHGFQSYRYNDPSANLWSAYLSKSEKYDRTMAQNWKGDMDAILIFAGLFSASVTAFIVESYKTLNTDPNTATVVLLAQISQQLGSITPNSTVGTTADAILSSFNQSESSPSTAALVCNTLWFLSLGFSLICALSATLVEQWTRHYLQGSHSKPAPQDRARLSAYLYQGVKKYKMALIVETIPMLLHISLFLFFAGLIAFLDPVNKVIKYLIIGMLVFCCILYTFVTALPIFQLSSPYWTPLSTFSWTLLRRLRLLHRHDPDGNKVPILCSMQEAREVDAMDITAERDQRDLKAMCWTINSLREDNEFEPFVEVIPSVVAGFDYSAKWLMDRLMNHDNISIKLGYRIPRLLASCTTGLLDPFVAQKRAITCLKAIWSLTMLSMPKPTVAFPASSDFRENLKFKEDTFDLLYNVGNALPNPDIEGHILSSSIVVARSLLNMQMERAVTLEGKVLAVLDSRRISLTHLDLEDSFQLQTPLYYKQEILDASMHRMQELEDQVLFARRLTNPVTHVMIEAIALHHTRMVSLAHKTRFGLDAQWVELLLESIKKLQGILNQAGFNLALEYVEGMLDSDALPHEAGNTFRRTFFSINLRKMGFTQESQERLVRYLNEAVEQLPSGLTRLPQGIISILLNMTRGLDDPTIIMKAIHVIDRYSKAVPSNDKASATMQTLKKALPQDAPLPEVPKLDLFSSHLYATALPIWKHKSTKRTNTMTTLV